jgi:RND family efflux transporter MFP subunit
MDLSTGSLIKTGSFVHPKRTLRTTLRWMLLMAAVVALAAAGWWFTSGALNVTGGPASRGPVADVVYATGFVEPRRPVDVSSRVTAPVTAVLVDEGDHVRRGQALATLDGEDQRQTIVQFVADRVKAEQDEARALALFRQGWMARAGRDQAVAAANSARAAEASARAKLDQYTIRSGISGVVLRRDVEPGDLATAARTLFEIGDSRQLRVTATVDERDIPMVRTGLSALMSTEAYPGRVFRGTVYEITPGGDPDQRAFRVRIAPAAGFALPIGLTLEVNILVAERSAALLVPASAIRDNRLWVVENGRARRRSVDTGIRGTDRTEIRRGLRAGACVISNPPDEIKDGERVSVTGC